MAKKSASKRTMPAFTKPSDVTLRTFDSAVEGIARAERRTMFGYPSVFVGGNMLACVFQDRIMVRLSVTDRTAAIATLGAKLFEPSPGRAMKEYVELPKSVLDDASLLRSWFAKARTYVATLPPKKSAEKRGGSRVRKRKE